MRPGQKVSEKTRAKMREAQNQPGVRERRRAAAAKYWTPERKQRQREDTIARMADPAVRAKISQRTATALADPNAKMRQRVNQQAAMARPEVRKKISERTKSAMANPEVRKRIVDGLAAVRARPDHGARISVGIQKAWAADHERKALNEAWQAACADVRRQFLETLGVPPAFAWAAAGEPDSKSANFADLKPSDEVRQ